VSRDKRDVERATRRANRLAERAEERAERKERHAERASERAERLAERVKHRPGREKDLDQSIEDLVDEVTQKAEEWIDEKTHRLFDSSDEERDIKRAEGRAERARQEADKARANAKRAERAADELHEYKIDIEEDLDSGDGLDDLYEPLSRRAQRKARRASRKARRSTSREHYADWIESSRARARGRRSGLLYRDRQRKKVCGVCAGLADYFGRPAWEMRLYAVLGLVFIPSITVPAYFIMYFLMRDKPYYRRVTDRFKETIRTSSDVRDDASEDSSGRGRKRGKTMHAEVNTQPKISNVQAMKSAKAKFSDIEQRLRGMESHVTSSRFELQRELKKISGED
jgi:phage shock protein C